MSSLQALGDANLRAYGRTLGRLPAMLGPDLRIQAARQLQAWPRLRTIGWLGLFFGRAMDSRETRTVLAESRRRWRELWALDTI